MQILCTICSEIVRPEETLAVVMCGHLFHRPCLTRWLERSKSCPQCRNEVADNTIVQMYPAISDENRDEQAVALLQSDLNNATLELQTLKSAHTALMDNLATVTELAYAMREIVNKVNSTRESTLSALRIQMEYNNSQAKDLEVLQAEKEALKRELNEAAARERVNNENNQRAKRKLPELLATLDALEAKCRKLADDKARVVKRLRLIAPGTAITSTSTASSPAVVTSPAVVSSPAAGSASTSSTARTAASAPITASTSAGASARAAAAVRAAAAARTGASTHADSSAPIAASTRAAASARVAAVIGAAAAARAAARAAASGPAGTAPRAAASTETSTSVRTSTATARDRRIASRLPKRVLQRRRH